LKWQVSSHHERGHPAKRSRLGDVANRAKQSQLPPPWHGGQVLSGKRVMTSGTHTGPRQNKANCRTGRTGHGSADLAGPPTRPVVQTKPIGRTETLALPGAAVRNKANCRHYANREIGVPRDCAKQSQSAGAARAIAQFRIRAIRHRQAAKTALDAATRAGLATLRLPCRGRDYPLTESAAVEILRGL